MPNIQPLPILNYRFELIDRFATAKKNAPGSRAHASRKSCSTVMTANVDRWHWQPLPLPPINPLPSAMRPGLAAAVTGAAAPAPGAAAAPAPGAAAAPAPGAAAAAAAAATVEDESKARNEPGSLIGALRPHLRRCVAIHSCHWLPSG